MIAKYDIDPDDFYFARTLNAAAIATLAEDVNGKNRTKTGRNWSITYISVLETRPNGYLKPEDRR